MIGLHASLSETWGHLLEDRRDGRDTYEKVNQILRSIACNSHIN